MVKAKGNHSPILEIGIVLLLWFLFSIASYFLLASTRENRFDLFPRWVGAQAVLRGESPYSEEVTLQIQLEMLGRPLEPHEDQARFAYAAYITWLLLPFWLLPFPIAISLWSGLQLFILLALPVWIATILKWKIHPVALLLFSFFSVFIFRYPMIAYLIGQFIPFLVGCLVMIWWGAIYGRQKVMAFGLLLLLVRPEVVIFPLFLLLILIWQMGYRKVVWFWFAGLIFLWVLTRIWIGPWEIDFLRGMIAYQTYAPPVWPLQVFQALW